MDMDEKNEKKMRKELRIKQYDYSSAGAYFVTICIKNRRRILSEIIKPVGVGAHDDPRTNRFGNSTATNKYFPITVGVGALDDPFYRETQLSEIGRIVEKNLMSSENISGVKIDRYVIMPNHIHVIIVLDPDKYIKRQNGSSRAPTPTNQMLPHVISTFKRFCNKEIGENIFQRGYIEHIIRDKEDYETRVKYIYENPMRWYYDELYAEE